MRVQLALNVRDIDEAVEYYGKLFNVEPNKRRKGYANFAINEPPLKLVLFEDPNATERLNHLGVEVFDDQSVEDAREHLGKAGLLHLEEDDTVCCHATQNKVWSYAPQGLQWEWYKITDQTPDGADMIAPHVSEASQPEPACCD